MKTLAGGIGCDFSHKKKRTSAGKTVAFPRSVCYDYLRETYYKG